MPRTGEMTALGWAELSPEAGSGHLVGAARGWHWEVRAGAVGYCYRPVRRIGGCEEAEVSAKVPQ